MRHLTSKSELQRLKMFLLEAPRVALDVVLPGQCGCVGGIYVYIMRFRCDSGDPLVCIKTY